MELRASRRDSPATLEALLEWKEQQPARREFDGFNPPAMTKPGAMSRQSTRPGCRR
jgi:hypothetical protein